MKHGSLFSGIGGFDLAAEWMGWENVFHCEWNEFGQRVLKYYWPKAISYDDITTTDFTSHRGRIDVLSGGFPCQPYSTAGKRLGKEDDRHLWPEMLRAIREIKPKFVVGENVSGIISWNEGLVFNEVQADLEAEGYEVQTVLLPAAGVDAPHRRDRVWFIAYTNQSANGRTSRKNEATSRKKRLQKRHKIRQFGKSSFLFESNTNSKSKPSKWLRLKQREISQQKQRKFRGSNRKNQLTRLNPDTKCLRSPRKEYRETQTRFDPKENQGSGWQYFPTQPPICSRDDGFSNRLDGITFSKWRNESIKAYGNAIVPQVAYQIFKALEVNQMH